MSAVSEAVVMSTDNQVRWAPLPLHNVLRHNIRSEPPRSAGDVPADAGKGGVMSEVKRDAAELSEEVPPGGVIVVLVRYYVVKVLCHHFFLPGAISYVGFGSSDYKNLFGLIEQWFKCFGHHSEGVYRASGYEVLRAAGLGVAFDDVAEGDDYERIAVRYFECLVPELVPDVPEFAPDGVSLYGVTVRLCKGGRAEAVDMILVGVGNDYYRRPVY